MHRPESLYRLLTITVALCIGWQGSLSAADPMPAEEPSFSPAQLEFFEKSVRPILIKRCYKCHSAESKELQGGLRVDARAQLIAGGDTGAAIVPGKPTESLLIEAIGYDAIYQMPPSSKMPAEEIAALTKWVGMGAPWPAEEATEVVKREEFDLQQRIEAHWSWRKLTRPELPHVSDSTWPQDDLDRFILARLEAEQWQPAARADRRTLIRRLYFDLIGLPPEPADVEVFLHDDSPQAYARLVDRLLDSPRFGERWARHWLDLVRYAESRGHEFDYNAPNAYQYRDYVIRALNHDVPYNQFVTEQVAGDLLTDPRTSADGQTNESILGTGFWFLGEWVHSPVDIRQDEADRHDNMIDVFSKTFLGLTVACARCHDHKFDAIAQSDYYALAGFLQSTTYRQARFESMLPNREVNRQLAELQAEYRPRIARAAGQSMRPTVYRLADYLLAARQCIAAGPLAVGGENSSEELVIGDFEAGNYQGWEVTGDAFGSAPQTLQTIAPYQGKINGIGRFFVNSHNVRGEAGKGDSHTGTLTSPGFTIERDHISLWVGGGAHEGKTCVNLLIDGKAVRTATGRNNNQLSQQYWNVSELRGKQARLEIVDQHTGAWGNIGVDQIVQTDHLTREAKSTAANQLQYRSRCQQIAQQHSLDGDLVLAWTVHLLDSSQRNSSPVAPWFPVAHGASPAETEALIAELISQRSPAWSELLAEAELIIDYADVKPAEWIIDGPLFGTQPLAPGTLIVGHDAAGPELQLAVHGQARRDPFWNGLELAPGTENDPGRTGGWVRAGQTIRTPTFHLTEPSVHYLVRGAAHVYAEVDSHRVNQGPLHGRLISRFDTEGQWKWVSLNLERYREHGMHLEFSAKEDQPLEIVAVVQAERAPSVPRQNLAAETAQQCKGSATEDSRELARSLQETFAGTLKSLTNSSLQARGEIELAAWMLDHGELFQREQAAATASLQSELAEYDSRRQTLSQQRVLESHTALAMWEGNAVNEHLFIRGNHKTLGEVVPRRTLISLLEDQEPDYGPGSGRLKLARQLTSPENPYTSRVMVNRVWHHLFGHGLVRSVDNFGVLGQKPSHPQLLDHLATQFMQENWSVKRLIRRIVLSSSYQMASGKSEPAVEAADPNNMLLHRQHIKRLEGEIIRDSILAVSGRLNDSMYGPSVPIHLTAFLQGRGRPGSGPLDGNGRRSVYLSVRRNFLSPMMLAFDTPIPSTTVGRRNVSNVPAQALILLNDPLVIEQAGKWAEQVLNQRSEVEPRLQLLYRQAFARKATGREIEAASTFLTGQGAQYGITAQQANDDQRVWTDLCHVLLNAKEFIYIR